MRNIFLILTIITTYIIGKSLLKKTKAWACYHWDANDILLGTGVGDVNKETVICQSKGFLFAHGDGTCGACWCCQNI